MFTVTKYPQGTFSWADCTTTDTAAGKQFYAGLMGWEIADFPMGPDMGDMVYTMFMQDGQAVGSAGRNAARHAGDAAILEQLRDGG